MFTSVKSEKVAQHIECLDLGYDKSAMTVNQIKGVECF